MDSFDVEFKNSQASADNKVNTASESNSDTPAVKKSALINSKACSSYISVISQKKGLLNESHLRTFNQLSSNLNGYIQDKSTLENIDYDESSAQMSHYRKLAAQVINRDPALQEQVAQDLSNKNQLVRTKDASNVLTNNLQNLPKALNEGSAAGKNLGKFICQAVVNLTDYENMGAGLQRDLSIRDVFAPNSDLNLRQKQATKDALSASIAFVKSNQKEVLDSLPPESDTKTQKDTTASTPQVMTRYLRKALNDFPQDSTYLDIFKQNKTKAIDESTASDEISKETSKRIHDLIAKAAITARKGNLIPAKDTNSALQETQSEVSDTKANVSAQRNTKSKNASELTLSELSARAAKLQQQFREERQRLASEGKLPDPASRQNNTVTVDAKQIENLDRELTQNVNSKEIPQETAPKATQSEAITADKIKEIALEAVKEALKETVKSQLEASQNTAKEVAANAVKELSESVKSQIADVNLSTKQTVSEAIKAAIEQSIKSQNDLASQQAKEVAKKAVNELTQSVKEQLQQSVQDQHNLAKEQAKKVAADTVSKITQSVKEELEQNASKVIKDQVKAEIGAQQSKTSNIGFEKTTVNYSYADSTYTQKPQTSYVNVQVTSDSKNAANSFISNLLSSHTIENAKEQTQKIIETTPETPDDIEVSTDTPALNDEADNSADDIALNEQKASSQVKQPSEDASKEIAEDSAVYKDNASKVNTSTLSDTKAVAAADEPEINVEDRKVIEKILTPLHQLEESTDEADSVDNIESEAQNVAASAEETYTDADADTDEKIQAENLKQNSSSKLLNDLTSNEGIDDDDINLKTESENLKEKVLSKFVAHDESENLTSDFTDENTLLNQNTTDESAINTPEDTPEMKSVENPFASLFKPIPSSTDTIASGSSTEQTLNQRVVTLEEKASVFSEANTADLTDELSDDNTQKATADLSSDDYDPIKTDNKDVINSNLKNAEQKPALFNTPFNNTDGKVNTSASQNNEAISQKIIHDLVPKNELEDSVVPSDIKGKGQDISTITTNDEAIDDIEINSIPTKTAGAAAITNGQNEPIPTNTVVDDVQPVQEKSGLFSKIASLFGGGKKEQISETKAAETQSVQTPLDAANMLSLSAKGSPLDNMMYTLRTQILNPALPQALKNEAKRYLEQLENPIDDLPSVSNWLNFTQVPMSPSSPQALALHQWAFMLLAIRFSQIGKSVDKFLKKNVDLEEDVFDEELKKLSSAVTGDGKNAIKGSLQEALDQIIRFQNPPKENLPVLYQYIPLPPSYEGGREGGFNAQPVIEEDGKQSWHLSFVFDLEGLGPIEIRAEAKIPELKLSVVASTLKGLQKVQQCLPVLKEKLQNIGITTRTASARLGQVHLRETNVVSNAPAKRNDGSNLSVDI